VGYLIKQFNIYIVGYLATQSNTSSNTKVFVVEDVKASSKFKNCLGTH